MMPKVDLGQVVGEQGPEGPVAQGTMMTEIYDPNGREKDVFAYADEKAEAARKGAEEASAAAKHASQHSAEGADPLDLDAVGAAKSAEHNVKTYTSFEEIGLTEGSETIADIMSALPSPSVLYVVVGASSNAAIYPYGYGLLVVEKNTTDRVHFRFTRKNDPVEEKPTGEWIGFAHISSDVCYWTGWQEVAMAADYLPLTGGKITGNLAVENSYPVVSAKETTSGRSTKTVAYPNGTGGIENYADASNYRGIRFNTESDDLSDAVQLVQMKEGVWSAYDILHAGNRSALGIPKCVTGTYTGTGTYGADNPCSLTFDFAPKMVILLYSFDSDGDFEALFGAYNTYHITMFGDALTTEYVEDAGFGSSYETQRMYGKRSEDGKTFSWYAKRSAAFQYNVSGTTYTYLAIGYEGDDV